MSRFARLGLPTGPQGQKRPEDPVAAAAAVLRIATGESDEKAEAARAKAETEAEMPKAKPIRPTRSNDTER